MMWGLEEVTMEFIYYVGEIVESPVMKSVELIVLFGVLLVTIVT
jgi:hypothetical protein